MLTRALGAARRFGMAAEEVGVHLEIIRWRRPGADVSAARARAICRERRLDRLLREVEGASGHLGS
jgi:hypothetical protein